MTSDNFHRDLVPGEIASRDSTRWAMRRYTQYRCADYAPLLRAMADHCERLGAAVHAVDVQRDETGGLIGTVQYLT